MQTLDFIQTVRWMSSLYSKDILHFLSQDNEYEYQITGSAIKEGEKTSPFIARITHDLYRVIPILLSNPHVPKILAEFSLEALTNETQILSFINVRVSSESDKRIGFDHSDEATRLFEIRFRWMHMVACADKMESLLIPSTIINEKDSDEILTLQINEQEKNSHDNVENILKLLTNANQLYLSVSRFSGEDQTKSLTVIYVNSGSSIRFDLLGLGRVVKQVKELLVEAWRIIRYRPVEDIVQNNKAILSNLTVLKAIASHRKNKTLGDIEAAKIHSEVVNSIMNLLETGALPREIPAHETVDNQGLIREVQLKLLPAPTEEDKPQKSKSPRKSNRKKQDENETKK